MRNKRGTVDSHRDLRGCRVLRRGTGQDRSRVQAYGAITLESETRWCGKLVRSAERKVQKARGQTGAAE